MKFSGVVDAIVLSADMKPRVESGVKGMRLIKTDQATLVGFHMDAYRTLGDLYERVLRFDFDAMQGSWLITVVGFSTDLTCSWLYYPDATDIDYDAVWNRAKNCIIESWGGDFVKGVLSTVSLAFVSSDI